MLPKLVPSCRVASTEAFVGVKSLLPEIPQESYIRLDGRGLRETSARVLGEFFQRYPRTDRILVAAATDTSALGALQVTIQGQREKNVAIVGQDGIPEVLDEMKKPFSPIIGSISHQVQTYGPRLIQLGVAILRGTCRSAVQLCATSRRDGWHDAGEQVGLALSSNTAVVDKLDARSLRSIWFVALENASIHQVPTHSIAAEIDLFSNLLGLWRRENYLI